MINYILPILPLIYFLKLLFHTRKPSIQITANTQIAQITAKCSTFVLPYTPTFWCCPGRPLTMLCSIFRDSLIPRYNGYTRETLDTEDGGQVSIDWDFGAVKNPTNGTPIVIFSSGITNSSQAPYIKLLAEYFRGKGWISACYVYRGLDHTEVLTPVTYYCTFTNDLEQIVKRVNEKFPSSPITLVGVSLGAMITFNTLARCQDIQGIVKGAVCISMPWNPFITAAQLHSGIDYFTLNAVIIKDLKAYAKKFLSVLSQKGIGEQDIDNITRIKGFDEKVIIKVGGYGSLEEYYIDAGPVFKLGAIKTPLLAINAVDDPFSFPEGFPSMDEMQRCDSPIALLKYPFGGHAAFPTKLIPTDIFIDKVTYDFLAHSI